jgi:hypothetical protein
MSTDHVPVIDHSVGRARTDELGVENSEIGRLPVDAG